MDLRKVTIVGGGVLGSQIGLMCAYVGKEVTFWLRSEGSVERTKPKLERYSELMINDLLGAKALVGSPMGKYSYPRGLIRDWDSATAESIDDLAEAAKERFEKNIRIGRDLAEARSDADVVIEAMAEDLRQAGRMLLASLPVRPSLSILLASLILPPEILNSRSLSTTCIRAIRAIIAGRISMP